MVINLKVAAKKGIEQSITVDLRERLPENITGPCHLKCDYSVQSQGAYFLLTLKVSGQLALVCQRCLNEFTQAYSNETTLAVCSDDDVANQLMRNYECIVVNNAEVDIIELLTDELYLYSPLHHPEISDCREVEQFIELKNVN
jgi:uncharacterized protein